LKKLNSSDDVVEDLSGWENLIPDVVLAVDVDQVSDGWDNSVTVDFLEMDENKERNKKIVILKKDGNRFRSGSKVGLGLTFPYRCP
jgi:hypothetical protein